MIKKFVLPFTALLFSTQLAAMPKKFEVWFLSADKSTSLFQMLKPSSRPVVLVSQRLQCEQMGDYCFDPQVGLYKPGEKNEFKEAVNFEILDDTTKYHEPGTASSLDRQLVNCEGENTFDIFCGKANAEKKPNYKMELWIDFSSSMKQVDFISHDQPCQRENFLRAMVKKCGFNQQKMRVMYFNEVLKEGGRIDDACLNHGLNQPDRLMREISSSDASHLIIITDIFEAQEKFINFIEANGGTHKGIEKPFYPKEMEELAPQLSKNCN